MPDPSFILMIVLMLASADRVRIEFTKWAVSSKNVAADQPAN